MAAFYYTYEHFQCFFHPYLVNMPVEKMSPVIKSGR